MEFSGRIIVVTGRAGRFMDELAGCLMARGGRTVIVADTSLAPERQDLDRVDAAINIVEISHASRHSTDEDGPSGIAEQCKHAIEAASASLTTLRELLSRGQPHGYIVNVALLPKEDGSNEFGSATAIAETLATLTRAMAHEWAPHVRVNSILLDEARAEQAASYVARAHDSSDAVFAPILFLASTGARHITGTALTADAGRSFGFAGFAESIGASA